MLARTGGRARSLARAARSGLDAVRSTCLCSRGNVAIEFGFLAPVAAVLMIGTIDLGLTAFNVTKLRAAARAGVQYALENPSDTAGITQVVLDATALPSEELTVTPSIACECAGGSAVTCGAPCPPDETQHILVSVEVTQTFVPLIPFTGFGLEVPVSGWATLRAQ